MVPASILVVDDDKLTRFSVSRILERAGYRTREAATAQEGLAAVEKERPDVVLLDIRLPDGDGFAVLREIRARFPGVPVVLMTAHHVEGAARAAVAMGARAYLAKPCDPTELHSVVTAALSLPPLRERDVR